MLPERVPIRGEPRRNHEGPTLDQKGRQVMEGARCSGAKCRRGCACRRSISGGHDGHPPNRFRIFRSDALISLWGRGWNRRLHWPADRPSTSTAHCRQAQPALRDSFRWVNDFGTFLGQYRWCIHSPANTNSRSVLTVSHDALLNCSAMWLSVQCRRNLSHR